jgi:hypothetical protein
VTGPRPWRPEGVELADAELARLSYLVVDEIVGGAVDVSVSPWPGVDERGRLVFPEEPARTARAEAEALRRFLARDMPGRGPLRMGDAFAARVSRSGLKEAGERLTSPSVWLRRPVHDLRAPARDKAKEAFFAAVAPTLTPAQAKEMQQAEPT